MFTIENIKRRVVSIVSDCGMVSLSLFGFYTQGDANNGSDLDLCFFHD